MLFLLLIRIIGILIPDGGNLWLRMAPYPNDYGINTEHKTEKQIADEIKEITG